MNPTTSPVLKLTVNLASSQRVKKKRKRATIDQAEVIEEEVAEATEVAEAAEAAEAAEEIEEEVTEEEEIEEEVIEEVTKETERSTQTRSLSHLTMISQLYN